MKDSQTTPTTAECIEWLEKQSVQCRINDITLQPDFNICIALRAQLLAAQEMAKAVSQLPDVGLDYCGGTVKDKTCREALTAWRKAGGQ